jgi:hypothetical protein
MSSSLFYGDDAAEVVPLEENVAERKPAAHEQLIVFFQPVWNQNVFKRFPFLGDFHLTIAVALFEIIIVLDEGPVDL